MVGSVVAAFIVVLTLQLAFATNPSQPKAINVEFDDKDLVESRYQPGKRAVPTPFVGDLTIGKHRADEQLLNKIVRHSNQSNDIQVLTLNFTLDNGAINFVSAENVKGSQAAVCGSENILGGSSGTLLIRVPSFSDLALRVVVGSHD